MIKTKFAPFLSYNCTGLIMNSQLATVIKYKRYSSGRSKFMDMTFCRTGYDHLTIFSRN